MATVSKRGKSYRIRFSVGYTADGKQVMKSKTWTPAPGMTAKQIEKELNRQWLALGDQWRECGRLFTKLDGSPIGLQQPYQRLRKFCEEKGMPFYGIHQFRHLNASLLIYNEEDVRSVSAALGHSQTSTTLNIYSHTFESAQARAADALADKLPVNFGRKHA